MKTHKTVPIFVAIILLGLLVFGSVRLFHKSAAGGTQADATGPALTQQQAIALIAACKADGYEQHGDGQILVHVTTGSYRPVSDAHLQELDSAGKSSEADCHRSFSRNLE